MTELEVSAMADRVLAVPMDADTEQAWAQESLAQFRTVEQRIMAEWKLARLLRDDAAMTALAGRRGKGRAGAA